MTGDGVALVLSGGGARGAYEAGALSTLLPFLEERGERPTLFVGTSVGAINSTYLASVAGQPAADAAAGLLARWHTVDKGRVVRPIMTRQAPLSLLRYAGSILSVPNVRLPSLLDPQPLERHLARWIDWPAIARNVVAGRLGGLVVVATAAHSGRSVAFVEGAADVPLHHSHAIRYVRASITAEHVRASAAIPILFPPVHITAPREAAGWYFDGGTRLNTPIKPALDLGAGRVVVISPQSVAEYSEDEQDDEPDPPDFGDGALHVLQASLVDPLIEDLRMLGNINAFFADPEQAPQAQRYREARDKPPYRPVPYLFVAPRQRGAIGELAIAVFHERYGGLKGLRAPDYPLLNRLLGGESPTHGELLSYLFFDPEFLEALAAMGRDDARHWLDAPPGAKHPWQLARLDAFAPPAAVTSRA